MSLVVVNHSNFILFKAFAFIIKSTGLSKFFYGEVLKVLFIVHCFGCEQKRSDCLI